MAVETETVKRSWVENWQAFLNSLDTTGGHIVLLLFILGIMQTLTACHVQSVDQFRGECIGALLYALKGTPGK